MDRRDGPVRWTTPDNLSGKLQSCMSHSGCVILTESDESYKNILRKSMLWHPFCKTTAKSTEEVCHKAGNYFVRCKARAL